jgi:hypothetical protein
MVVLRMHRHPRRLRSYAKEPLQTITDSDDQKSVDCARPGQEKSVVRSLTRSVWLTVRRRTACPGGLFGARLTCTRFAARRLLHAVRSLVM